MGSLRVANRHLLGAVLLTVALAATSVLADPDAPSKKSDAQTAELAAQFQARMAESLLVLVSADSVRPTAERVQTATSPPLPNALVGQQVPQSNLVAALLASRNLGLGGGGDSAAAAAAAPGNDRGRGRRPVSPNHPPDGPPGPPDGVPPGPPGGVPPGPPGGNPPGRG